MADLLPPAPDPDAALQAALEARANVPCSCDLTLSCDSCQARTALTSERDGGDGRVVSAFVIVDETEGRGRL